MKNKIIGIALAITLLTGVAHAQTASAVSAASVVPMAIVLSAGIAGGSSVQSASAVALSVPAALSIAGAELVVETVGSTAKGVAYGLRRVSDGAKVSIEVLGKATGEVLLATGSVVMVVAITGGIVLSAAGHAIAFIPNTIGKSLLHNRVVK